MNEYSRSWSEIRYAFCQSRTIDSIGLQAAPSLGCWIREMSMNQSDLPEAYLILLAPGGQREVYPVASHEILIGRALQSDIVLASPAVSRRHARLEWDGAQFLFEDLGSKNGTRVNGQPLTGKAPVYDGDVLQIAESRLQLQMTAPTVTVSINPSPASLSIDLSSHQVRVRAELVHLTPKEFRLLAMMYRQAGATVGRQEIAKEVWPELAGDTGKESIDQAIARLRRKIEQDPANPRHIKTVRGFGYRLEPDG